MVDKTLSFVLGDKRFKSLGGSRTDAMVSALNFPLQLFVDEEIAEKEFLHSFNINLPSDIRAKTLTRVDTSFNLIQAAKSKEYIYVFGFGDKHHPFSSSLMAHFTDDLDLESMIEAAPYFEGTHNFKKYCTQPSAHTKLERTISLSQIESNQVIQHSFFPEHSYLFRIQSKGFMRNQVRLIMGQLIQVGLGQVSLTEVKESLLQPSSKPLKYIAPASGLILNTFDWEN